jgi:hypothetical protein
MVRFNRFTIATPFSIFLKFTIKTMQRSQLIIFLVCLHIVSFGQNSKPKKKPVHQMSDQEYIFQDKMELPKVPTMAEEIVQVALSFMGTRAPHFITDAEFARIDPREVELQPISREYLAVSLDLMDCVGFVETVIGVAQAHRAKVPTYSLFRNNIRQMRYRNGVVGYADRLHYFSDWIYENEKRGMLKDVSKEIGGEQYFKDINYMSQKRDTFYGNMADPTTFARVRAKEIEISARPHWYIHESNVQSIESQLKNGDIIAVTNAREGMDIAHCGFVLFQEGRAHMMHASTQLGYVTITKEPMYEYLNRLNRLTGIMVLRMNE